MNLANSGLICVPKSFKLAFQNDPPKNIAEINEEILDSVRLYAIKAVLAYTKQGRAVTFEELAQNGVTEDLPADGSEVTKVLTFDLVPEKLFVLDKHSAIPLSRLKLTVAYRKGAEAAPESEGGADPKLAVDDDYTADVFIKVKETEPT